MKTLIKTLVALLGAVILFSACENAGNSSPIGPFPSPTVMLSGLDDSDCEADGGTVLAGPGEDQLEAVVTEGKVTFTHSGATYNCCLDSVGLDIMREDPMIRVLETEYAGEPCFCTCDYTIYGEIADLPPGDYTLEVVNAAHPETVLCSTTVTVM